MLKSLFRNIFFSLVDIIKFHIFRARKEIKAKNFLFGGGGEGGGGFSLLLRNCVRNTRTSLSTHLH
jgi:hypothetical protein